MEKALWGFSGREIEGRLRGSEYDVVVVWADPWTDAVAIVVEWCELQALLYVRKAPPSVLRPSIRKTNLNE